MYHLSAKPLIERFRNDEFEDREVAPYFVLNTMLGVLLAHFSTGISGTWDIATGIILLIGTYAGIMHLRNKNGGTFGNGYLNKYFTLGWITLVRSLILTIPIAIALMAIGYEVGVENCTAVVALVYTIIYLFIYFYWLGALIAKTHTKTIFDL